MTLDPKNGSIVSRMRAWLVHDALRFRVLQREVALKRVHLTTLLLAAAITLTIGFAGGLFTGHYVWKPTRQQITRSCPPNRAQIGCVIKLYAQHAGVKAQDPSGPHFPDVYEGQGFPNWAAAKPSISGAVVKAFEYREDHSFAYNAGQLTRLGIRWGAYLFVRGCGYGPAFAATVRPWIAHISVLVLDMEVPAAGGCAPALYASVHEIFPTVRIVIYSGPGTWPGGSSAGLSVWVASYGPAHPPCLFTCHTGASNSQTILAWQLTDGTYGFRIYTPGIGYGDDSLDYGLFTAPAPTRVSCFGHARSAAACKREWSRAARASRSAYQARGCAILAGRVGWFAGRLRAHPHVRTASRRRALSASRRAYTQRACAVFAGRASYFDRKESL